MPRTLVSPALPPFLSLPTTSTDSWRHPSLHLLHKPVSKCSQMPPRFRWSGHRGTFSEETNITVKPVSAQASFWQPVVVALSQSETDRPEPVVSPGLGEGGEAAGPRQRESQQCRTRAEPGPPYPVNQPSERGSENGELKV